MIKIAKWSNGITDQKYCDGDKRYCVSSLIIHSKDLVVREMPLDHVNIANLYPELKTTRDWIGHIKAVLDADLGCPIILDDEGFIMDGRHRIAKALLDEKETIKFVRFEKNPSPDYFQEEKK